MTRRSVVQSATGHLSGYHPYQRELRVRVEDDIVPTAYVNSDVVRNAGGSYPYPERPSRIDTIQAAPPLYLEVGTIKTISRYRCSRGSGTFAYVRPARRRRGACPGIPLSSLRPILCGCGAGAGLVDVYATGEDLFTPADAVISASSINASGRVPTIQLFSKIKTVA